MAIETNIYQSLKPIDVPDLAESQAKQMKLSQLAMQNAAISNEMQEKQKQRHLLAIGGAIDEVAGMKPELREQAYNERGQNLVKMGIIKPDELPPYSDQTFSLIHYQVNNNPQFLALKKANLENQKIEEESKYTKASHDPDSEYSKKAQAVGKSLGFGREVEGMSADQIKGFSPLVEKSIEAKQRSADRGVYRDHMNNEKQDKAFTELTNHLENFRGNKAAQQANQDILSADKTMAMVAGKDPNTLTTQDLGLLASEMAKIATGGVPGEHGVQQLMPNNLSTKVAEMQSFLMSKPSDANAGAYIQKNMNYLKEMSEVANKTLGSYRKNILKGYKNRVKKEDYDSVVRDYGLGDEEKSPGGSKIRVSNGKEMLEIDPSDLEHAIKDGFQQVK